VLPGDFQNLANVGSALRLHIHRPPRCHTLHIVTWQLKARRDNHC
jgi:hypothetical protein